jgi:hypothetical protein
MKNSFILYTEQKAVIDKLTDEQAGRLIKAIYAHETGEEMELDSILDLVITPFLTSLERNTEKYQKRVETNKKNIAKRWNEDDTKNTNGKNGIQNDTNDTNGNDSDSDSDSDNVNDLKENTKRKVFAKPTVEEVKAYCTERKNNVDANKFIDFYESKGWLIGKNPMKDWKACVRTWEKTSNSSPPKPSNAYINPSQSEYDDLSMFYSN